MFFPQALTPQPYALGLRGGGGLSRVELKVHVLKALGFKALSGLKGLGFEASGVSGLQVLGVRVLASGFLGFCGCRLQGFRLLGF